MDNVREFGATLTDGRVVSPHARAVLEALLVTVLWSSSYVLIKVGLADIPALTFAGLRYALAFAVLLPVFVYRGGHRSLRALGARDCALLAALGLLLYAVTQGAQFVALGSLQAATVSLMLTFTPVLVALLGLVALDERPSGRQWAGVGLLLAGALLYFSPFAIPLGRAVGLGVMCVGLAGNAGAAVLGRHLNRGAALSPLAVTTVSMGIGSLVLLGTGVAVQGLPPLSPANWAVVAWLAVVNTAGAFTLWNRTLQTLSAVESSVINNTMLVQIAVLGWVFLGEELALAELAGLALVGLGALVVQVVRR